MLSALPSFQQPSGYRAPKLQYSTSYVSKRQQTSAYVSMRQRIPAVEVLAVSVRQHTSAYVSMRQRIPAVELLAVLLAQLCVERVDCDVMSVFVLLYQ
jgi:hypothetical protein